MSNAEDIWGIVDDAASRFLELSDRIWDHPEIAYQEFRSVEAHRDVLALHGFRITEGIAGIPTAIMGEAGSDGPVIAILGEYDALPRLSQAAGIAEPRPLTQSGAGHGCGHNLLGSGALLAASAVKAWLEKNNLPGRVRYYGCPAEEGGAAKTFMVRAGLFDDVDIAITWHPWDFTRVAPSFSLANTRMDFAFTGRAAHAAAAPHLGRSALDAVELMNVGVNYLREHVPTDSRIHYAMLDSGGTAPNVVQAYAAVRYAIRANEVGSMIELNERVTKVAEGAALMTETTVHASVMSAVSNLLPNSTLEAAMQTVMDRLGPVPFDDDDRAFAARIQDTLTREEIGSACRGAGIDAYEGPICDFVVPREAKPEPMVASTDVGDVSWVVPTVQAHVATFAIGTPFHSWQMTSQGKTPAAHKGMVHAAKIMASTAKELMQNPDRIEKAKAELAQMRRGKAYVCPISPDVNPPIVR